MELTQNYDVLTYVPTSGTLWDAPQKLHCGMQFPIFWKCPFVEDLHLIYNIDLGMWK